MALALGPQPEFEEDAVDVGLDGFGCEEEPLAYALVREALGHQGEDFALAAGELVERIFLAAAAEKLGHDLRVDRRPARADAADRVGEVSEVGDPVFEQVADLSSGLCEL